MQGIHGFIPSKTKAKYINSLLDVGFDTIDFGSFVSPKAIPQMKDTAQVLGMLDLSKTQSKLLAIVANLRGANDACEFEEIDFLGYPFSISETFQLRNTNATIEESLHRVSDIQAKCLKAGKELVIYISMGFGNPYGDEWNVEICQKWVDALAAMNIKHIALSDTIGVASPESISYLFGHLIPPYPDVEFGAHLHTRQDNWKEKVIAAYIHGCRRFDGAIKGYGGCPMAKDELTGNMPTEHLVHYFNSIDENISIDMEAFNRSMAISNEVFLD
ncbi:MAG: hydroxymethylglutaryl-CoA lyase [Saprospiraceae bacterium]|nr:hydroxymethylglutaryl-CoA lyase [Saprospiraceae bacterium]